MTRRRELVRGSFSAAFALALASPGIAQTAGQPPLADPAPPATPRTSYRGAFLCLPYVGFNLPVPDSANAYSVGFRAGALLGYHLLPFLSINSELTIDLLNVNGPNSTGYNANEAVIDLTVSPLIHFELGQSMVVIGPKLGLFRGNSTAGYESNEEAYHGSGLAYGLSLGVFFPVSPIALGVLLNYAGHSWRSLCESDSQTRQLDVCNTPTRSRLHILGLTAAMLF